MGGSDSKFVTKMLDDPALKAKFYKEMRFDDVDSSVKAEVERNLRKADVIVNKKKEDYDLRVSVQGVVVNLNKSYALILEKDLKNALGKDWSDPEVLAPTGTLRSTDSAPFFHAKKDGAKAGCAGAFQYAVKDSNTGVPACYLAVSWFNPYNDKFRSRIRISDVKINLDKLTQDVMSSPAGKHEDVDGKFKFYTPEQMKGVLGLIETFMDESDTSMAYIVVAIQGDHNLP